MVALALLLLLVAMVARRVAATEAPDAKTHFGNFCRLQRNRQPSLPPKTEILTSQKRVRISVSLPILPPYPYSDPTELDFSLRA